MNFWQVWPFKRTISLSQTRSWLVVEPSEKSWLNSSHWHPPLVNCYITIWKITIFRGEVHYKWGFSIVMLNCPRVIILIWVCHGGYSHMVHKMTHGNANGSIQFQMVISDIPHASTENDDNISQWNLEYPICRRKFRSETSDNMDSWKAEVRRVRREKIRRKKMQMREKVGKSRFTVFFQWFVAPEGRKVGSLKRRVRSQLARWEMKKCTPLWREAHFQVKMYKTHQVRTTFGSCDVEKVHAVVARSTFPSQNVQNTPMSDHFWKLRCRKSARRCGAKHISKSKCTKHTNVGPLLEVEMMKKCTPLWREAHFQVKSVKNLWSRTTFWSSDVEKVSKKCTPLWREAHFEVKSVKNWGFWAFFDVKMSKK